MKITKESSDQMTITNRNISIPLLSMIFIILGLLIIIKPDIEYINLDIPIGAGILCLVLGTLAFISMSVDTVVLDKTKNILQISRRSLSGLKNKQYSLDQIKEIQLWATPGNRKNATTYKLGCLLQSGETEFFSPLGRSGIVYTYFLIVVKVIPEIEIGQKVADFLHVNFNKEMREPTLAEKVMNPPQFILDEMKKRQN